MPSFKNLPAKKFKPSSTSSPRSSSAGVPARSAQAATGTLEAAQVRAMFDRIAGVYDPLNTAMTAGLHHRWRARAADLARVGPGSRVLDVATGTGDLAIELAGRVAPGRRGDRQPTSPRDARPRAREGRRARVRGRQPRFEWADAHGAAVRRRTPSTRRPSASARATSTTSRAGSPRWRAWCAPAGAWWCSRSPPRRAPPLSLFYRLWFDRIVPALGPCWRAPSLRVFARLRDGAAPTSAIADAYTYLPNSVKRFPGAGRARRRRCSARACRRSATCSRPAGSWRSTRAPCRRSGA